MLCKRGSLDFIRNKLTCMNVDLSQAQAQPQEVCGPDRVDPKRVQRVTPNLCASVSRAVPGREDYGRQAPQAPGGRRPQRGIAGDGAEVVIHFGPPKGLSPANPLGRGVRAQSA